MKEIYLLRHAKAAKTEADHRYNPLSEEGVLQAKARRKELNSPMFDLVISSPLIRARQTASLIADVPEDSVLEISTLFYDADPDTHLFDSTFEKIQHADTTTWYASEAGEAYKRIAARAGDDIHKVLEQHSEAKKVLVVGHAIGIPAIADYLRPLEKEVLNTPIQETGGFKLSMENGKVQKVTAI